MPSNNSDITTLADQTGYIDNIPFIHKWTSACKPYEIDINLNFHGIDSRLADQQVRVVDLGCGSGITLLMLASVMPHATFLGIDFNADHIAWAKNFARKCNLKNITFKQETFSRTLQQKYGMFDLVICQGVYSWVSDTIRSEALACIDRLAAPDAALQISWNTEAGYAQLLPLRGIVREMIKSDDPTHEGVWPRAIALLDTLETMQVPWFEKNPIGRNRIDGWKKSDLRYLAHEYLNETWHLSNFNAISRDLSQYGFKFSGYSYFERWRLNNPDIKFDESHTGLEEQITELAMCLPHRNDTFARGARHTDSLDLEMACFACAQPTELVPVQVVALDTKNTTGIMYHCLQGPKTVSELIDALAPDDPRTVLTKIRDELSKGMIIRVDSDSCNTTHLQSKVTIEQDMEYSSAFSRTLLNDSKLLTELACFPSSTTRGAVRIPPQIALIVDAFCQSRTHEQWLQSSRQRLADSGLVLDDEKLNSEMQSCIKHWTPFMLFHGVLQI